MGNKVDLIDAIYSRLLANTAVGKDLAAVKRVRVGSIEDARKPNDFPILNILLDNGAEDFIAQPTQKTDKLSLIISLITNKESGYSSLYDKTNSTGILFLLEKLLNCLDKLNDGSTSNLNFGTKARDYTRYTYQIKEYSDWVEAHISMTMPTATFSIGSR